jgi:hypothetical protein
MGKRGRSRGDIPRSGINGESRRVSRGINGCLVSVAVLLTKPGIAEGCALDKMVDCEVEESREGSRDDEMKWSCDGVEGSRRRNGGLKRFEIFECGGTLAFAPFSLGSVPPEPKPNRSVGDIGPLRGRSHPRGRRRCNGGDPPEQGMCRGMSSGEWDTNCPGVVLRNMRNRSP